jgi:hypothetical protein
MTDDLFGVGIDLNWEKPPFTYIDQDLVYYETGNALDLFRIDPNLTKVKGITAHKRKQLLDRVWVSGSRWFLISERAWTAFQHVRCCETIKWIPTLIYNPGGEYRATYQLAYAAKEHDIWDYSRSEFYWYPGKTPGTREAAGYMKRGLVDWSAVPKDKDFFRASREEQWFGTKRLCEVIHENALTGFQLRPASLGFTFQTAKGGAGR